VPNGAVLVLIHHWRGVRVITPKFHHMSKPLALLVGGVLLIGCSGEENIPLKKVDFVLDAPPKDYIEKRKAFSVKGLSSKIGRDPTGISNVPAPE
jgi:hypothetical protein